MRLEDHDLYAGKIMRSKIYNQGGSFTLSDLTGKLRLTGQDVKKILDAMVDDGQLMEVIRPQANGPSSRAYAQQSASRRLMACKLAYYSPPLPEKIRHYNEWLKTVVAYELNNA